MLANLYVRNFGLMDTLNLEFSPGLNVLTGETGAGKSIIIEALQIVLGGRASGEMIRSGAEKSFVQAAFDLSAAPALQVLLDELGVGPLEDGILTMAREISHSGKNSSRINGVSSSLTAYRLLGKRLVDLHVQHEQQSLLDPARQLGVLDRFGAAPIGEALSVTEAAFRRWRELQRRYDRLCGDPEQRAARADLLRYQCEEIEGARLSPGEDGKLAAERVLLASAEKVHRLIASAYAALYEGERGQPGAVDILARSAGFVKELADLDVHAATFLQSLENARYLVEDVSRDLVAYRERLECDPGRLEAVEERLEQIRRLKKKYGETLEEVLDCGFRARAELEDLENSAGRVEKAAAELAGVEAEYRIAASLLRGRRQEAAKALEEAVKTELLELEMGRVDFQVGFAGRPEPAAEGLDQVDFLIATNPGEPLKPLAKIASGGELSRVMLALKGILAVGDDVPTLVFDEVDTGIGGWTLQSVAEKLARIGDYRQVLCVTHAAQVAACAGSHFRITKAYTGGRTVTTVKLLEESERVDELARMLGGREATGVARQHASQLLKNAQKRTGT
jgi:DNA repair protein RecN (Recombination protein N)